MPITTTAVHEIKTASEAFAACHPASATDLNATYNARVELLWVYMDHSATIDGAVDRADRAFAGALHLRLAAERCWADPQRCEQIAQEIHAQAQAVRRTADRAQHSIHSQRVNADEILKQATAQLLIADGCRADADALLAERPSPCETSHETHGERLYAVSRGSWL